MSIDPDKCSSDDNVQHDSNNQVCDSDINYESDNKCNSDNSEKLVPVPDSRLFTHMKYEQRFKWLYFSVAKGGSAAYSVNCLTEIGHFVEGVKSLSSRPIRILLKHKKSKTHCKSVEKYVSTNATSGGSVIMLQKAAERNLSEEKIINTKYMETVIKTVVFTVKNRWAMDSVSSPVEFLKETNSQDVVNFMQKHKVLCLTS